jgi:aminoglycoside phosphotransferase (APT) family kinase protein
MVEKKPNSRLRFEQLPHEVREFAQRMLGSRAVRAESQAGGFSPGTADRLLGEDGSRVFVKAVSSELNAGSFDLFRAELEVWQALDGITLPAPALLGHLEFGDWIALAFEDVQGHEPEATDSDVAAVLTALSAFPDAPPGLELPPGMSRTVRHEVDRWTSSWQQSVSEGALELLPPYVVDHSEEIGELVRAAAAAADGDRLQHVDVHSDNVIVDGTGAAWIVDWPWVAVGAPWFDALGYLATLLSDAPVEVVERWASGAESPLVQASADETDAVLAGFAASRLRASLRPAMPSIVGLREAQREFALVAFRWLAHRRGWL